MSFSLSQLDALAASYTETFGSEEHDAFVVTMQENWLTLIQQARRAVDVENRAIVEQRKRASDTETKSNG